jgi:hypothetical protein
MPRKHTDKHGQRGGRRPRPVIESPTSLESALRRRTCSAHMSVFFRVHLWPVYFRVHLWPVFFRVRLWLVYFRVHRWPVFFRVRRWPDAWLEHAHAPQQQIDEPQAERADRQGRPQGPALAVAIGWRGPQRRYRRRPAAACRRGQRLQQHSIRRAKPVLRCRVGSDDAGDRCAVGIRRRDRDHP